MMAAETSTPVVDHADRLLLRAVLRYAHQRGIRLTRHRGRRINPGAITWRVKRGDVTLAIRRYPVPVGHPDRWAFGVGDSASDTEIWSGLTVRKAVSAAAAYGLLPAGLALGSDGMLSTADRAWTAACLTLAGYADRTATLCGRDASSDRRAGWADACRTLAAAARELAGQPGEAGHG